MASVWDYVADLIRITKLNEDPRSDFYKHLGGQAITDGPGSDNIPVICTAVAIARAQQIGNVKDLSQHLDRVERYLALPWMDREPGSRNAYSELITEGVECYYAAATKTGRDALAMAAKSWLDATYAAVALGAYPGVPDGNWTGPYITLTGARSGASRKGPDGKRWYEDGVPRPPWFFEDHPLSNRLGVLLGAQPHAFVKDLYEGYKRLFGVDVRASFGPEFRKMCRDLVGGQWNPMALTALRGIPGPRIPFSFLRASNGAATVAHTAIQYGSTSMMYALAAWDEAPSGSINALARRWGQPHLTMLLLDNPKFRTQPMDGRAAHASLHHQSSDGYKVVGIRQDKQAYDEHRNDMVHRPQGKSMPLPSKDPRWLVLWNKDGAVEILNEDGPPPPPPPPGGGNGWHTVLVNKAHLKFTNSTAREALSSINGGSNHVSVSQVALLPEDLAALTAALRRIVDAQ